MLNPFSDPPAPAFERLLEAAAEYRAYAYVKFVLWQKEENLRLSARSWDVPKEDLRELLIATGDWTDGRP